MKNVLRLLLLVFFLTACGTNGEIPDLDITPDSTIIPPVSITPIPSETKTQIPPTESLPPTHSMSTGSPIPQTPYPTPILPGPAYLELWREYQQALGTTLFPFLSPDDILCEWEILGQVDTEDYLWMKCTSISLVGDEDSGHYSGSIPAVMRFDQDGMILEIKVPGAGSLYAKDIRNLFPVDIQDRIFDKLINYQQYADHLEKRLKETDIPPLIVILASQ